MDLSDKEITSNGKYAVRFAALGQKAFAGRRNLNFLFHIGSASLPEKAM